jgi:hypothetical protein
MAPSTDCEIPKAASRAMLLPRRASDGDQHPILLAWTQAHHMLRYNWEGAAGSRRRGPAPPILLLSLPGNIVRIPASETE